MDRDILNKLFVLLKSKKIEVKEGIYLKVGEEIKIRLYMGNPTTLYCDFESPLPFLIIDKPGGFDIWDIEKNVESIHLTKESYTLVVKGFPDVTRDWPKDDKI
jgi:hypothetical protein